MEYLRQIEIKPPVDDFTEFPFTLNYLQQVSILDFNHSVIFFVGENGSGKSTLLEAIAYLSKLPVIGGESLETDRTMAPQRKLSKHLKPVWNHHPHRGFFLRAEDFIRFANKIRQDILDLEDEASSYRQKFSGYALQLAEGAVLGQKKRFGKPVRKRSFHLFARRKFHKSIQ